MLENSQLVLGRKSSPFHLMHADRAVRGTLMSVINIRARVANTHVPPIQGNRIRPLPRRTRQSERSQGHLKPNAIALAYESLTGKCQR